MADFFSLPYGSARYDDPAAAMLDPDLAAEQVAAAQPVVEQPVQPTFTEIPAERQGMPVDQPPTPPREMTPEEAQAAQDEQLRQQLAAVDRRMKIMGLTGGGRPAMRMNELQREGFRLQGQALEQMRAPLETETAARAAAMQQAQDVGAQYIADLKTLQARQRGEAEARKAVMAEDERRMRETEEGFDASRLLRQMGERPLETTALSFAAGLVGMLKGSAGRTSPNDILAEVDKAVERDVMNQKTAYDRMLKGMEVRRTNFLDARQMGADEQSALATTAAASLDQYRRAIDFAAQRVGDAQTKAKLTEASGQLKMQQGDLQMRIDEKNAAAAAAQFKSVQDMRMRMLESAQKSMAANPEEAKYLANKYPELVKQHQENLDMALGLGELATTLNGIKDPAAIREFWNSAITKAFSSITDKAQATIASSKDVSYFKAIEAALQERLSKAAITEEQKAVQGAVQRMVNLYLRKISGGAVTDNESQRDIAGRALRSYDEFMSFVDRQADQARATVGGLIQSQKPYSPATAALLASSFYGGVMAYDELKAREQNLQRVRQAEAQSKGKR